MNKDQVKMMKLWIKNLRSGEYKQTHNGGLKIGSSYCCLGVACDVAKNEGLPRLGNNGTISRSWDLSQEGRKVFGLTKCTERTLIHMNDVKKKSFKDIANFLEKKFIKKNVK